MTPEDVAYWTEYRRTERALYSWCLQRYGGRTAEQADEEAVQRYPSIDDIIFHDMAWHWAMLEVIGENYWMSHPELEKPSPEYQEYSDLLDESGAQ